MEKIKFADGTEAEYERIDEDYLYEEQKDNSLENSEFEKG
jgi:hypothetical protein